MLGPGRSNLDKPARPLLANDKFDIPPDTEVEVTTTEGYIVKGNCYKNPAKTKMSNGIEVVNCQRFDPKTGKTSEMPFQRFLPDNIRKLTVRTVKRPFDPATDIPERIMATKVVATETELENMFKVLEDVKIIGLSLQGVNVSLDGLVGWICIFTHGILICIDVIKLEHTMSTFWGQMEVKVFANASLLKVVHNIRPMTGFLYHRKVIRTKSLYCTQLGELYIRCHMNRDKMPKNVDVKPTEGTEFNWIFKPLSYCLEKFIPEKVNIYELPRLKDFESKDFSKHNPMMIRPMKCPEITKCVAISMKYLLELYEAQIKILMSHYNQCVQEQVKFMMLGNMADHHKHITDPSTVAHNVQEMMVTKKPDLVTETENN